MTHFLGRLVERARGTAPRIEPIIASRFAPAPVTEIALEREAPPTMRAEPDARLETESVASRLTKRAMKPQLTIRAPRDDEAAPSPAEPDEASIEIVRETLLVPVERTGGEVGSRPGWTRGSGSLRRDPPPHVQSDAAPAVVRRANHHPRSAISQPSDRAAVSANSLALPNESAAQRPIVRVTIGRIEVRAVPGPAPAHRKPSRAAGPKLTLDAYLKSRKEGAR